MENIYQEIINYFREKREPVSLKEISNDLNISQHTVYSKIRVLKSRGIVSNVGNDRYSMWILNEDNGLANISDSEKLNAIFNDKIANTKGASEELENKVKEVKEKIDAIQINMISIMGVLVAVFSLVISNAQRIYDISQYNYNIRDLIKGIIISNISTIIVIFFLLLFIHIFLGVKKRL